MSEISYINEGIVAKLFRNVFWWMTLALITTGVTAFYVSSYFTMHPDVLSNGLVIGLCIVELALVIALGMLIKKISFATAGIMFAGYSLLNGVTLSVIFMAYTMTSIASAFFVTAGTFGVMAFIGSTTKIDLSKMGSILIMALIGLVIASVVNLFWANSTLYWIVTYAGVLIFVGLTAYDAQNIKMMLHNNSDSDIESLNKIALIGSLSLYLDFINLFISILRIIGGEK